MLPCRTRPAPIFLRDAGHRVAGEVLGLAAAGVAHRRQHRTGIGGAGPALAGQLGLQQVHHPLAQVLHARVGAGHPERQHGDDVGVERLSA